MMVVRYLIPLLLLVAACAGGPGTTVEGQVRLGSPLEARPVRTVGPARYVPGEVLVQLREGVSLQGVRALQVELDGRPISLGWVRSTGLAGVHLYRGAIGEAEMPGLLRALQKRPEVAAVSLNWLRQPLALSFRVPEDPLYFLQWHYPAINLPQAWAVGTGRREVVVALLDSGVLYRPGDEQASHPDWEGGRMLPGYDMVSQLGLQDPNANAGDGDGRDPDPYDEEASGYHGTHVGGIIAAATDNRLGVAGVDWSARLLPIRVIGRLGGSDADIIDGLLWAVGEPVPGLPRNPHRAGVINLSLGGRTPCTPIMQRALDRVTALGAVVVAAAGNENGPVQEFAPASCANVIAVGATDRRGYRARYSNYGVRLDVMAPGGDTERDDDADGYPDGVLSLGRDRQGRYGYVLQSGTSMAAAHVAGLVALMKGLDPSLSTERARLVLRTTARPLSQEACGMQEQMCGAGLVDAYGALQALQAGSLRGFHLSAERTHLRLQPGEGLSLTIRLQRYGGFTGPVRLSLEGAPQGLSAGFSPQEAEEQSLLSLRAETSLARGVYSLLISGRSAGLQSGLPLTLVVGEVVQESIRDTQVVACWLLQDESCDRERSKSVRVDRDGRAAGYRIEGLVPGQYAIFGWKDVNGDGVVGPGDYLGALMDAGGQLRRVRPGERGADFQIELLQGPAPWGFR